MSRITNDNFNRDTKLDPSPLNAKFSDIATATADLDENNVRNSGIDAPQFDVNVTHGRNNFQLYKLQKANLGSSGGTVISHDTPADLPNDLDMDGGAAITLTTGDIIRVSWYTETSRDWATLSMSTQKKKCWLEALQWKLGAAAWGPVPGQANIATFGFGTPSYDGFKLSEMQGSSVIHHMSVINNGGCLANAAPTEAVPTSGTGKNLYLNNEKGSTYRLMSSGSWFHTVTAGESGSRTLSFRLKAYGLLTPYYDNTVAPAQNYLVIPHTIVGTPTLTVYDTYLSVMIMRPK